MPLTYTSNRLPMNMRPDSSTQAGPPQTIMDVTRINLSPPAGWTSRNQGRVQVDATSDLAARTYQSFMQLPEDGFLLNPYIFYLPYYYQSAALIQSETIRKANQLRDKLWLVPDSSGQTVAAYDTLIQQIQMMPGSWLYGMRFITWAAGAEVAPANFSIQITDACTGQPLWMEYVEARAASQFRAAFNSRLGAQPYLMLEPRLIMTPGLVNVEICNRATTPQTFQLALLVKEPCMVIQDAQALSTMLQGEA